ncbi:MAG: hypothetical protein M1338_04705 [Patescibacteria group bacterium]|nr:hypothetical protein [Patescibacteria group bacterium]
MKIKNLKFKIIISLLALLFLILPSLIKAADNNPLTSGSVVVPTQSAITSSQGGSGEFFGKNLKEYSEKLYVWSIGIAGSLAIIMLIYAGYLYVTSMGNPDNINSAKEIIIGALSGLLLLILASLILRSLGIS